MVTVRRAKKFVKKAARKVYRLAKKRYTTKKGLNMTNIVKDVQFLKSIVNAEKKRIDLTASGQLVGQCNANAAGLYQLDVTPIPTEGSTYNDRNGSSIKLTASHFSFQMWHTTLSNSLSRLRFKFMIFQVLGQPQTVSTFITNIFNATSWSGLIDFNSMLNPDYRGQYRIIRTVTKSLRELQIASSNQQEILDVKFGIRYNRGKGHHIRYVGDNNAVADGQLIMVILCDNGNISGSSATTLPNIPLQTTVINSGCTFNQDIRHYYFDN